MRLALGHACLTARYERTEPNVRSSATDVMPAARSASSDFGPRPFRSKCVPGSAGLGFGLLRLTLGWLGLLLSRLGGPGWCKGRWKPYKCHEDQDWKHQIEQRALPVDVHGVRSVGLSELDSSGRRACAWTLPAMPNVRVKLRGAAGSQAREVHHAPGHLAGLAPCRDVSA